MTESKSLRMKTEPRVATVTTVMGNTYRMVICDLHTFCVSTREILNCPDCTATAKLDHSATEGKDDA